MRTPPHETVPHYDRNIAHAMAEEESPALSNEMTPMNWETTLYEYGHILVMELLKKSAPRFI
jgi:hypothetical protein